MVGTHAHRLLPRGEPTTPSKQLIFTSSAQKGGETSVPKSPVRAFPGHHLPILATGCTEAPQVGDPNLSHRPHCWLNPSASGEGTAALAPCPTPALQSPKPPPCRCAEPGCPPACGPAQTFAYWGHKPPTVPSQHLPVLLSPPPGTCRLNTRRKSLAQHHTWPESHQNTPILQVTMTHRREIHEWHMETSHQTTDLPRHPEEPQY